MGKIGINLAINRTGAAVGPSGPSYLLDDEFTTAKAAPIGTPRTAEPGPGSWTVTDGSNNLSIASGAAVFAAGTIYNPQVESVDAYNSAAGVALLVRVAVGATTETWTPWLFYYHK